MELIGWLKNKEVLLINGLLILFFWTIAINSPWKISDELLLLTPDSMTYYDTGKEFFTSNFEGSSIIRPFLYASFLYLTHSLGGAYLVVIIQFLLWLASANLVYVTLKKQFLKTNIAVIGLVFFSINVSLIGYSFHGLTEVVSTFLLALLTYILLSSPAKKLDFALSIKVILILALLTAIKPLFYYPFVLFSVISVIINMKFIIRSKISLVFLLLAFSPVVLQISIMKTKHDVMNVSTIGSSTFNRYLLAQGIRDVEKISDVTESENVALKLTDSARIDYLWSHKSLYARLFFNNVREC